MSLDRVIRSIGEDHIVVLTDGYSGASESAISGRAVTADQVAFLARTGGIIGIVTTPERCDDFEARSGISTEISALDRARSIRVASHPDAGAEDVVKPGHVLPASARPDTHREPFGLAVLAGAKLVDVCERGGFEPVWIEEFWDRADSDIVDFIAAGDPNAI